MVLSGDKILKTGYYGYRGHTDNEAHECFVPPQSNRMFFKKDKVAPLLGSCEHIIEWLLLEEYKK